MDDINVFDIVSRTIREARGDTPEALRAIDFVCRAVTRDFRVTAPLVRKANMRQLYQIAIGALSANDIPYEKIVNDNATVDVFLNNQRYGYRTIIPTGMTWAPLGLFKSTDDDIAGTDIEFFLKNSLGTMKRENRVEQIARIVNGRRVKSSAIKEVLEWLPQDELDDVARRAPKATDIAIVSRGIVEDQVNDVIDGLISHSKKAIKNRSVRHVIANDDELLEKFVRVSISPDAIARYGKNIDIGGNRVPSKYTTMNSFLSTKAMLAFVDTDEYRSVSISKTTGGNNLLPLIENHEPPPENAAIVPVIHSFETEGKFALLGENYDFVRKCASKAIELGFYREPTDRDYNAIYAVSPQCNFLRPTGFEVPLQEDEE